MDKVLFPNKVAYFRFYYQNQSGISVNKQPPFPTRHGHHIPNEYATPYDPAYPSETMLERTARHELLDIWTPVCKVQLSNSHSIMYRGHQAIKMKGILWNQLKAGS